MWVCVCIPIQKPEKKINFWDWPLWVSGWLWLGVTEKEEMGILISWEFGFDIDIGVGAYDDEEAAARAYDLAALKYWGQDTMLNFPVNSFLSSELLKH